MAERTSRRFAVQRRAPLFGSELLSGGNFGVSLHIADRIGPYDEDPRVAMAEDREWAHRALRLRIPIMYCPEITVRHVGWRTAQQRSSQYNAYGRSLGAMYGRAVRSGDALLGLRFFLHLGYATGKAGLGWLFRMAEVRRSGAALSAGMIRGVWAGLRGPRAPLSPLRRTQRISGESNAATRTLG